MDWLALATGVVALPSGDGAEEAAAALASAKRAEAENFLIAGGRLSPQDWAALAPDSRRAFVEAAVAVEKDRAMLFARAVLQAQANPAEALAGAPPA